jgi:hypothetical protein
VGDFAAGLRLLFELVVVVGFIAFCWILGLWWVPLVIVVITAVIVVVVMVETWWSGDV